MLSPEELREKIEHNVLKCGCWVWLLSSLPSGYGQVSVGKGRQEYAHRVSYRVFHGNIPKGFDVMHSCDNPRCVNPDHLSTGTRKDNMLDCSRKGRANNGGASGERNGRAKITLDDVREIRSSSLTVKELSEKYGVTPQNIRSIRKGLIWQEPSIRKAAGGNT